MQHSDVPLSIALWQVASVPGDVAANLRALDAAAGEANAAGAHVLVTPEMFLTGYNIGEDVARLAPGLPLFNVGEIAARHGIAICVGGPEQLYEIADDAAAVPCGVANTAWFFDERGEVIGRHRKIQLFGELDRALFVAGDAPATLVRYRGHTLAMLICFDVEFPETVRAAALAGAEAVLVPTAQMEPFGFVNEHLIPTRAWENGVYVAYVNQHGTDGELTYVGRSVAASPLGEVLSAAPAAGAHLGYVEISREKIAAAKAQSPYLAELRREVFAR